MYPIIPHISDVRRAIVRARQDNLQVVGQVDAEGIRVYAVPSRSHPTTVHLVYIEMVKNDRSAPSSDPSQCRVICDCPGFHYRGVCAHTMVVTRAIIAEAQSTVTAQLLARARQPDVRPPH